MRPHTNAWFSDAKPAALPGSTRKVRDRSCELHRYARARSRSASRRGHAAQDVRPHSRRLRRRRALRYVHSLFSPACVGDASRSGKKTSDDLGTSAILSCANLVGLGKHQLLLGRRDNHDPGFVGKNDIPGLDLNLAQHDWLVDRGGLEVPFARDRRQAAHEGWETGGPDCWPVARCPIDEGAGHAILLAGIAVELAPARRIESAAIIDYHNIALLRDFAGDLLMAREPGLAVVAGTFRHLPQSDRRTNDFRPRGSQHHKARHHRSPQVQGLHGVADLATR